MTSRGCVGQLALITLNIPFDLINNNGVSPMPFDNHSTLTNSPVFRRIGPEGIFNPLLSPNASNSFVHVQSSPSGDLTRDQSKTFDYLSLVSHSAVTISSCLARNYLGFLGFNHRLLRIRDRIHLTSTSRKLHFHHTHSSSARRGNCPSQQKCHRACPFF